MASIHPAPVPEVGDADEAAPASPAGGSGSVDTNASHMEDSTETKEKDPGAGEGDDAEENKDDEEEHAQANDFFGRGLVYCQGGGPEGLASYHFESTAQGPSAYISYASAPSEWTLDNGSPFPEKKPFLDPAFDAASRTFTGWIDWMVDGDGAQPGRDSVWKVRFYGT